MGCPFNVSAPATLGAASAVVNWTEPAVADNTVAVTSTPDTPSGSSFNLGDTPVTYTAQDAYGNTATCIINVNVYGEFIIPEGLEKYILCKKNYTARSKKKGLIIFIHTPYNNGLKYFTQPCETNS